MTDKKYELTVNQKSGLSSNGDQSQDILLGDHYHGNVYKKLAAIHEGQLTFDPQSLKEIIIKIDQGIESINVEPIDFSTSIDINEKNKINNHSRDYFEEFVELDFYPQFYKLDNFFGLKENQNTLQIKTDRVIKSLNRQILAFQGQGNFEIILLQICKKLIDENHDTLKDKEDEILLIFYYFYCNCCIGRKTEKEKNDST